MGHRALFRSVLAGALAATISLTGVAAKSKKTSHPKPRPAPQTLMAPRVGIRAHVEIVPFNRPEDAHAPFKWGDVAWYSRGPRPGERGNAIVYGHLDSTCCPAIFYHLKNLNRGDLVEVAYPGNKTVKFKVQWHATYWNSKLPIKFMYGPTKTHGLIMATCAGDFHYDGSGYDHELLVYATQLPGPKKPKPTATPKPKPTRTPRPKPTSTPKPKPTATSRPEPTHTPKPEPTKTPKPKPTETAGAGTHPTATATATLVESQPEGSPTATATKTK